VGLAGATAIVAQHGGMLTLSSVEGQGTTVRVTLPRLQGNDPEAG
jgi:signal transduction histidine kinase